MIVLMKHQIKIKLQNLIFAWLVKNKEKVQVDIIGVMFNIDLLQRYK
jgi:hypothetical protein